MRLNAWVLGALAGAWTLAPLRLGAQEHPAKRVAAIVGVAVEEYSKAIDGSGRLVSSIEFDEAVLFLSDARDVAARLSGDRADAARAILDTLSAAVGSRRPPQELDALHGRFLQALGAEAALDMPSRPVDVALGRALFAQHCASCHGAAARGDGPAGRGMVPPPPALGDAAVVHDVTPALMYRVIAVGIAGTPMAGWSGTLSADERWSIVAWLGTLRAPERSAPGEGLFLQRCAACHGAGGAGDGALSASLSRLPVDLSSFAWQAERSDARIALAISDGVEGTAMPPTRDLSAADLRQLVSHVRSLSLGDVPQAPTVAASDAATAAARVTRLLDDALTSARAGRLGEAADQAFDAYIAFEPLETPGRARAPGRVAAMERQFADFRGALKGRDLRQAERARNAIEMGLPGILDLQGPVAGFWGNFLQSLLIILREGFEAILVVGAVVAFLVKTGHRDRLRSIWIGVAGALVASAATAYLLATVLRALPATREILEGVTMLVAVAVLFSVSYWLVSRVEAARWQQFIRDRVNDALQRGGGRTLAVVAFLAVYREGAETALFYQALFREGAGLPVALGIVIGGAALAATFVLFHRYGLRIPLRPFFAATSALLYYMAFVFMGKGIRELQEGDVVSITVLPGWPHVDVLGIFPSVETLLAQAVLLLLLAFALLKTFWPRRSVALPTVEPASSLASLALSRRIEALERQIAALEGRPGATGAQLREALRGLDAGGDVASRLDHLEEQLAAVHAELSEATPESR